MADREQIQRETAIRQLEEYRAGKAVVSEHEMIVRWGKTMLLEARPDIEPFLQSPDASLRASALHALAYRFQLQDYWSTAVQFLLYDPEYIVRVEGANSLAHLKDKTEARATLDVLASVVRDPYDSEMIRLDAYRAMLILQRGYRQADDHLQTLNNPPERIFDLEKDTDWDFVNACVDPAQEKRRLEEAQQWLEQYRAGKVAERDYYAMLLRWGRAKIQEARVEVEGFLKSPVRLLHTTALRVLILYLQVQGNWQMTVDILLHGTESDERIEAVTMLGLLMRGTRDRKTLSILDQLAWNDPDQNLTLAAVDVMGEIFPGLWDEPDAREKLNVYLNSPDEPA